MALNDRYEVDDAMFQLNRSQILIRLISQQMHLYETKDISLIECLESVDYLTEIYLEFSKLPLQILRKITNT